MSEQELLELKTTLIDKSPIDFNYNISTWTGALVIEYIFKHYDISYKKTQVYTLLKIMGFTYQKVKGKYPETDMQKQEEFKEG